MLKVLIKKILPHFVLKIFHNIKLNLERMTNNSRSVEEVFSDIYLKNTWGGPKGEYFSGSGSNNGLVVSRYVEAISRYAVHEQFSKKKIVDLGCGDFRVGRQLLDLCDTYVGVDIVKPLIESHELRFGTERAKFRHLNIIDDDLPDGDVCFVRQVFQHLSNEQILSVLGKLKKYQLVFITEHYPKENDSTVFNKDKVHGSDIRLYDNSGVYLTKSPFMLAEAAVANILEVPASEVEGDFSQGIIRTFLYRP